MDLQEKVEKLLPDKESWEWHEGARYRIKKIKDPIWYGLQVIEKGDQIEAKPIIVEKGNRINIIKSDLPFSSLDQAFKQLKVTEQGAITTAKRPRNPHNLVHLKKTKGSDLES